MCDDGENSLPAFLDLQLRQSSLPERCLCDGCPLLLKSDVDTSAIHDVSSSDQRTDVDGNRSEGPNVDSVSVLVPIRELIGFHLPFVIFVLRQLLLDFIALIRVDVSNASDARSSGTETRRSLAVFASLIKMIVEDSVNLH